MTNLKPATVIKIFWTICILGLILLLTGLGAEIETLSIIGTLVIIGGLIFMLFTYQCPHCGRHLDPRCRGPHCPFCGEKINE